MTKAQASPTKRFFVGMITRDISLEACVLDLLDNSLDGARRSATTADNLTGYQVFLRFDANSFEISDNCGGMAIAEAVDYAFHFGRRDDDPRPDDHSIGLYGIGMKRAVFKIGKEVVISSSTGTEAFSVGINVDDWLQQKKTIYEPVDGSVQPVPVQVDDWDFPLETEDAWTPAGTSIYVEVLHEGISAELADSNFENSLIETIQRDYSVYLLKGFEINVNGTPLEGHRFRLRVSDSIKPAKASYADGIVNVTITAGLAEVPQDDTDPEADLQLDPSLSGWFVLCNDRVVLAADKTDRTGWGAGDGLPMWHSQYNGFVGLVAFESADPRLLPWDTTKRDVETAAPVYRRALARMREMTRPYLSYTNRRKDVLDVAKSYERSADAVSILDVQPRPGMLLPDLPTVTKEKLATISYKRKKDEVEAVKEALGGGRISNAEAGVKTFEFFVTRMLG